MAERDVLIIGAGPAGYVCAIRLAQLGRKVTVVERERPGGVCLNWGCIPVKSLLHAAQTARDAVEGKRLGLMFQAPEIDLVALYSWKSRVVDRLVRGIEYLFKANGVELVRGKARFTGPDRVAVESTDAEKTLTADNFVIATGSIPVVLTGLEPNGKTVLDSNSALKLVELPKRLVIIGAGVIGLEFATIFSRLGCKVTVLELEKQVLPEFDPDLAAVAHKALAREGVEFHLGVRVQKIEHEPMLAVQYGGFDGYGTQNTERITSNADAGTSASTPRSVEADKVLVAVGRRALSHELGLDWAGVKTDKRGFVKVDSSYRTSVGRIFAIGDVTEGPMLAHRAMAEGIALAELLAGERKWKFRAIPSCVYTDPEVAVVGLTETKAQEEGRKVKVSRIPLTAVGRSLTLGRSEGFCKMLVDADTDKVLGVGMAAPQADALISEAAVAVELGLTAAGLGRVVHPHPTMSELLFEAAEAIHGRAVHIANK